ncbi:DUF4265 domain-containing protein [Simiduia agarivorans]|uniref:Low molecular weight phosphotyrosine protein phosphatase n=1 Tax=Simiduia agarivorans (strain DSM 21679 / JCM 13881 / BCRC 17597 / SA1) TaxID=1117647 RepID=K4L0M4_SIMAS|nr:DUF4265 domain-containing protein [Simiduia agarivorans]AFU99682.1 low molecular weight phosphotyrosine protein phosphatase [Simiduia agarivorans SA1 = DSM 21679]
MDSITEIEMFAGYNPAGQPVAEKLQAVKTDEGYRLVRSPAFIKGLASGDLIRLDEASGEFDIVRRSGNLCVRVFSQQDTAGFEEALTSELEKLGGELELHSPRMLVYKVHVSLGFKAIEAILEQQVPADAQWLYGNVYDPADGQTPLNWWLELEE